MSATLIQAPSFALRDGVSETDWQAADTLLFAVFGPSWAASKQLLEVGAPARLLLAEADGQLVGCIEDRPRSVHLHGREVATASLDALGVLPSHRGQGIASALMVEAFRRSALDGAVFALGRPPQSLTFHRRLGWELCGTWMQRSARPESLLFEPGDTAGLLLRPLTIDDMAQAARVYVAAAAANSGWMTRSEGYWRSLLGPERPETTIGACSADGVLVGYVTFAWDQFEGRGACLAVSEMVDPTARAFRSLWRAIGRIAGDREIVYVGPPQDPLYLAATEQPRSVRELHWIARLLDVPRSVAGLTFPAELHGAVELQVDDAQFAHIHGNWTLRIGAGTAEFRRGGRGLCRIAVGRLASMIFGYARASALHRLGGLEGAGHEAIALLDVAFPGPRPWMHEVV